MIYPITSIKAKCKDCYRCIRACPVKAIGLNSGQARVVKERCITCGNCTVICPQKAKSVHSEVERVLGYISTGHEVHVSLAPSYVAAFPEAEPGQVIAALKKLGFARIEETAWAAEEIAKHYASLAASGEKHSYVSACCPVVVNLIEIHYPELIGQLSPTVSPMTIHGRSLRQRYPAAKNVFIGPCISKMQEASRSDSAGAIDAVITFKQLEQMLQESDLKLTSLAPVPLDRRTAHAQVFALSRGLLASVGMNTDDIVDVISVSGIKNCIETFRDLQLGVIKPSFIEALACRDGCIGGSGMCSEHSMAARRARLVSYRQACHRNNGVSPTELEPDEQLPVAITRQYSDRSLVTPAPTDTEIRHILTQIGKHTEDDETNCGGCGYPSCRAKAIATYQGMAELEMCIPYMKAKFESLSHLVVDSSLNGVIIVNKDLTIHQLNPTAQRMFNAKNRLNRGAALSDFIDPTDFAQVLESGEMLRKRVSYPEYGLITKQTIYTLPEYGLVVGVITDITHEEEQKQAMEAKHTTTIARATQVINHQMKLAQEIAGLLGEATSETKATLLELITILDDTKESEI